MQSFEIIQRGHCVQNSGSAGGQYSVKKIGRMLASVPTLTDNRRCRHAAIF
jgi:hypothetical protein